MAWVASNIVHGRIGRMWMAVRDMDIAAQLIGIRLLPAKLLAFAVSSFYVGVAGALMVFLWLGAAEPEAFNINLSFLLLFMVIIGGLGSRSSARFSARRSSTSCRSCCARCRRCSACRSTRPRWSI